MTRSTPPESSTRLELVVLVIVAVMFGSLAAVEGYRWHRLHGATDVIDARVVGTRRNPAGKIGGGPPYQLGYRFSPPGAAREYSYSGQMLVVERWARIEQAPWDRARAEGTIPVRYSVADPRINQPAVLELPRPYDAVGFLGIFAFTCVIAVVSRLGIKRRW